jgi:hypothetical protein
MRCVILATFEPPDFGEAMSEPALRREIFAARIARLRQRIRQHGLGALVIYGDREHMAKLCWATGHDPRFEEALPLSNIQAWLPPFWLAPGKAMAMR